jgi:geranylgeranyl diphosphate synthase type I
MRLALCPAGSEPAQSFSFLFLPALCCQAAGGDPDRTVGVAAAWVLLYTAAHILDELEDGEIARDASLNINAATGLIFTAFNALTHLQNLDIADRALLVVIEDFVSTPLRMCSGQHADLAMTALSLERGWKIAGAKSGAFFALACRAGACLANVEDRVVEYYSQFGYHLGMLVQICDDLQGMRLNAESCSDLAAGKRTLPMLYALSVTPPPIRERLWQALQAAPHDPAAEAVARQLIEEAGALLYLTVEASRHSKQAEAALYAAVPLQSPRDQLMALLNALMPARQ